MYKGRGGEGRGGREGEGRGEEGRERGTRREGDGEREFIIALYSRLVDL